MTPSLILELDGKGLACEVSLNGIVLARHALREHLARAIRLDGWAIDGGNVLSLALGELPPLPPAAPEAAPVEPRFVLRLRDTAPGRDDRMLVEHALDVAAAPLAPAPVEVLNHRFEHRAPATWAWQRATPVPRPGAEDLRQVTTLLAGLLDALQRRDVEAVVRAQQLSLSEQALAGGGPPVGMLASYAAFLRARMAAPDWTVHPVDWRGLRLEPLGDGRVLRVTDARGAPPLLSTAAGSSFAIDPCVSRVDGRWVIVR